MNYSNISNRHIIWKFAIPQMIGLIFNSIYFIIDGIFIGRRLGPDALAAPIETIVEETIEETPTKVKASKKKTSTTKKDDVAVEKKEETTLDVAGDVAKTTKTKSTKTKKVTDTKTVVKEVKEEASETVIPSETEGGNDNE